MDIPNNDQVNEIFLLRLTALMKTKGINQVILAESTGMTRQAISLYATGKRTPSIQTLVKICDALNVSTDYLLGRTDFKGLNADDVFVNLTTGLSEDALRTIQTIKCDDTCSNMEFFNAFIGANSFLKLFASIKTYMFHKMLLGVIKESLVPCKPKETINIDFDLYVNTKELCLVLDESVLNISDQAHQRADIKEALVF